ncbi:MAG: hypothetical protein F4Y44_04235 [Chloroflexi bacterium]|nr:hypothetical protein [Chloroflexota bacterium]
MTTTAEQDTTNERLVRLETIAESLVREAVENRQDVRDLAAKIDALLLETQRNFRWTIAILPGIFLPFQIGLMVSLITLILTL